MIFINPTMTNNAIWIIDDDEEDHDMIREIFVEMNLRHELVFFKEAENLVAHLENITTSPFIIFCDVNLPRINGFELREILLSRPERRFHSVPFIFWSTQASEQQITKAFDLAAHGFFVKETRFQDWKETLFCIIRYCEKSKMPPKRDL